MPNTTDSNANGILRDVSLTRNRKARHVSDVGKEIKALPPENIGLFAKALVGIATMTGGSDVATVKDVTESAGLTIEELAQRLVLATPDASLLPDSCDFTSSSNTVMSCRDIATILLAVDRESHDSGMNSFNANRKIGTGLRKVTQLCNVSDALLFMANHALPSVRVPVVPLLLSAYESVSGASGSLSFIRSKFGRTNFLFDENGKPILSSNERAQISISNDAVMVVLAAFYACFDQRFEAIFYPTSKRELAMLSCAAQTSVASAVWQYAADTTLPESQDDAWFASALFGYDETSLFARLTEEHVSSYTGIDQRMFTGDCNQSELAREFLGKVGVKVPADKDSLPRVASVCDPMGKEAMGYDEEGAISSHLYALHSLLLSYDASPYPLMSVPVGLNPDRSVASMLLSHIAKGKTLPSPSDILVSFLRSFDATQSGADTKERMLAVEIVEIMVARLQHDGNPSDFIADHTTIVTKDAQLQYVLSMFVDTDLASGEDIPLSFRQLDALALGYKTDALKQALASDFELGSVARKSIGGIISSIVKDLDDRSIEREQSIYGETMVDPIRFTLAAMAMPERLASADAYRMQLSPQHLMSMLIEMPSAFSDAYGRVSGNRMLATYTRSNGRSVSSDIKVYQPFFMLHDDSRFGSRRISTTVSDDAAQVLVDMLLPDTLMEEDDDEGVPVSEAAVDAFIEENPSRAYEVMIIQMFISIVCGIDMGEYAGSGYTSCYDNKDLLIETIRNNPKAVASVRSENRYEIHPSVIRIADVLFRHMTLWERKGFGELQRIYKRCVALSLMLHTIVDKGVLSPLLPIATGSMFEAAYPRSWEGAEEWFVKEAELVAQYGGVQPSHRPYPEAHSQGDSSDSAQILSRSSDLGKLLACSVDMTASIEASNGSNIVERDEELQEIISVLLRREKSNVMILGEAGTGKTALVELLAASILRGNVPDRLKNKRLLQMDVMTLTSYSDGTVAEILDDAKGKDVILFIDEIHALQPRTMNALKPYLARADISLIGATTNTEYQSTILKDKALARRFSTIRLHELNQEQTVICIKSRMEEYERWYGVAYDTKTPYAIAAAASTYMTNRHSPDRELDVMDVSGALASMEGRTVVVEDDAYAAVRRLTGNKSVLSVGDVQNSITEQGNGIAERVEKAFGDIVSQNEAKRVVSEALALSQIGLRSGGSPKNVLMFVGPSGVGKTMMAERIPEFLGTSHDAVLSINLSEYVGKHEYSRLVGSPPGYIGFEQGGLLTNFGMAHPDGVVILDEIEKASPSTRQMLLKLFDRGYIESAAGEKVDCRSMTFVCTSNEGFASSGSKRIGFIDSSDGKTYETRVAESREALIRALGAPFVGRFDDIVVFDQLGIDDILQSCRNEYESLANDYKKNRGIDIADFFTTNDLDMILGSISQKEVAEIGARPIMKRVKREIERAIAGMRVKENDS